MILKVGKYEPVTICSNATIVTPGAYCFDDRFYIAGITNFFIVKAFNDEWDIVLSTGHSSN